jgi:ABC-type uncharacterized transport system substrate-binding protein
MVFDARVKAFRMESSILFSEHPTSSAARAQQAAMPVIGFLNGASSEGYKPMATSFRQGLKEAGYVEGHNVAIEFSWAEGQYDRLPGMAADLVRRRVAVIVTGGTPGAFAAKAATSTIPTVIVVGHRPGGNVTGLAVLTVELEAKKLELLHDLLPTATVIALLVNPMNVLTESETKDVQDAARSLGLHVHVLNASTESHRRGHPLSCSGALSHQKGSILTEPGTHWMNRLTCGTDVRR